MVASPGIELTLLCVVLFAPLAMSQDVSFDTNFVELDTSKMIQTSDTHYSICNHNFPSNWRTVSVNGNEVTIATRDNKSFVKNFNALTSEESSRLLGIKATLTNVVRLGPYNVKSDNFAKLTTFDRYGGTSTIGTGGSSSSSSSSSSSGGMSVSRNGPNAYIVSKPDFPFTWHRLFINEDVTTIVYRSGRVIMLPQPAWEPDEQAALNKVKAEVEQSSKAAEDMTKSLQDSLNGSGSPMDFVNKALGGMFGRR